MSPTQIVGMFAVLEWYNTIWSNHIVIRIIFEWHMLIFIFRH